MKIKGLAEILKSLDTLDESINAKVDEIPWSGDNDTRDQQRDEMLSAALDCVLSAQEALEEIKQLQLEDF